MSDATKARALQKLSMLTVKIGYPSKWRDYTALQISDADLFGDVERSRRSSGGARSSGSTRWSTAPNGA
jgi:predicted metalloendopeptidase